MIYLHIGLVKTGTTSIQGALYENWVQLYNRGVAVYAKEPEYGITPVCLTGLRDSQTQADVDDFKRRLDLTVKWADGRKIIMSREGIAGTMGRQHKRLSKLFAEAFQGHDTTIILYTRNLEEWLVSRYLQRIKNGMKMPFSEYVTTCEKVDELDFTVIADSWGGQFPLEVVSYDDVKDDLIQSFFNIIGVDPAGLHQPTYNVTKDWLAAQGVNKNDLLS